MANFPKFTREQARDFQVSAAYIRDDAIAKPSLAVFDPITLLTIITTLLPMIFQGCKREEPSPARLKRHAEKAWKARRGTNGEYARHTVNNLAGKAKVAARESGQELDDEQARDIAISALDRARKATETQFESADAVSATWPGLRQP
jgi:hypothetical protein